MNAPSKPPFRFGLRTLLIFTSVVCVLLTLAIVPAKRYQIKKLHAERMITGLGGTATHAGWGENATPGANWLSLWLGYAEMRETRWNVSLAGKAVNAEQVRELGDCPWIRVLDLSDSQVTDEMLEDVCKIHKLRETNLARTKITDKGLLKFKSLDRLYVLNVEGTEATYEGLAELEKAFPGANFREQLALARLKSSHEVFPFPKFAGNTMELDVFPPSQVPTVQDIHLDQGDNPIVTRDNIADLRQLASATAFRVQGKTFPDGGLSFLADLKNLQQVAIFDSNKIAVHDDDLKTIAALPKLTTLTLYGNELTDDGVANLSAAHQIQSLLLYGYNLTPELLVHLRGLHGLRKLDVMFWNQSDGDTRIYDPPAEKIAAARESVKNLTAIPNLEELSVMGNLMADEVVAEFANLKQLKSLKLDGRYCSQETSDAIQKALPDCKVERADLK